MLTADELKALLSYEPETGDFTWKIRRGRTALAGSKAGFLRADGYMQIKVCGRAYLSHRLAWLYMTGEWPQFEIDHINGGLVDNRWANLRDVDHRVNTQNRRRAHSNNKSGLIGASPHKHYFRAKIAVNGKTHSLGLYKTAAEAHAAYLSAKRRLHSGCTI